MQESDIANLMRATQREILCLFGEVEQILRSPSGIYERYPKLSRTLRIYWHVKSGILGSTLLQDTQRKRDLQDWKVLRARYEKFLHQLERRSLRPKKAQRDEWARLFAELKSAVEDDILLDHNVLVPALSSTKSSCELEELSVFYAQAMKKVLDERANHMSVA